MKDDSRSILKTSSSAQRKGKKIIFFSVLISLSTEATAQTTSLMFGNDASA